MKRKDVNDHRKGRQKKMECGSSFVSTAWYCQFKMKLESEFCSRSVLKFGKVPLGYAKWIVGDIFIALRISKLIKRSITHPCFSHGGQDHDFKLTFNASSPCGGEGQTEACKNEAPREEAAAEVIKRGTFTRGPKTQVNGGVFHARGQNNGTGCDWLRCGNSQGH